MIPRSKLTEDVKNFYGENSKSLLKYIKITNKWRDVTCSCMGRQEFNSSSFPKFTPQT